MLIIIALVIIKIIWVCIFRVRGDEQIDNLAKNDFLARRAYLIDRVYSNTMGLDDMPLGLGSQFQGEWAVGTFSMTSIALANLAFIYPETRKESLKVINILINRFVKPEFRQFDKDLWHEDPLESLDGPNGHIGYLAHLNMMLAAYHYLGGDDPEYKELFDSITSSLARRITAKSFFNAETYPGEIYVMDNTVVVASLALHERLYKTGRNSAVAQWLEYADKNHRDPETGLLAFRLSMEGKITQGSRGSGSGWACFFLFYADKDFASREFALVKKHLVKRLCPGVTGVREWPGNKHSWGDVDSGPLIFGLSPSGTGFSIAGARFTKDTELLDSFLLTSEIAGFTIQSGGKRRYATAPLVGDAIVLAMATVVEWKKQEKASI
ncbi:MAG: hypothetical protein GY754_02220 [bacterium]|nr:hypothetical protein [bacterium]